MARISFLSFGKFGDVLIHWDAQNDEQVLPVIQNMIDAGVRFFVVHKKKKANDAVTDTNQTTVSRNIVIPDVELERLHTAGLIHAGSIVVDSELDNTGEIAKTAAEVAENDTVAVAPASGG